MRCTSTLALVAASLLLPGCPLHDDYRTDTADLGAAGSAAGLSAGGGPTLSSSGQAGVREVSAASGGKGAVGEGGALDPSGLAGDAGSGTSGCVSLGKLGHEYAFCFTPLTQASARANCAVQGMTLAVIEDGVENAWIASNLSGRYTGSSALAFIGANDVSNEGEWKRADGVTFWRAGEAAAGAYANWGEGQPDDASSTTAGSADCLSMALSDGTWDDTSCDAELPYVCETR